MKIKITKYDVIWNWVGIIVSLFSNFLMIPFLVLFLDGDTYGLWNVFVSLGSISVLFDFGFNSMFSRNVSYCWSGVDELKKEGVMKANKDAKTNYVLLGKVIKTCQLIYFFISIIAFIGLSTIGTIYIIYVSKEIFSINILYAWIIYAIGVFLNLFYGYYDAFLRGVGEVGTVNKIRTIAKVVQITMTAVLLYLGLNLIGVAIAYVMYGAIFRVLCKRAFYSIDDIKMNLDRKLKIDKSDIKSIFVVVWYNAWKDGVVSIANYISNQVTTILCSLYLGLTATGEFGLIVQLFSAIAQISSSLFSVYQPALQEAYARREKEYSQRIFSFSLIAFELLYVMGSMAVIVIIVPILKYIRPQMSFNILVLVLLCIYQGLLKYRDCYACYLAGTNRLIYYKSFLFSAMVCLLLSLIFLKYFNLGIIGLGIAQIISQLIYNVWYWPKMVDNELSLTFLMKYKKFIRVLKEKKL